MIEHEGLEKPRSEWEGAPSSAISIVKTPIERLSPKSSLHSSVLEYLLRRIDSSEKEMQKFYSRWQALEKRMQAYIDLPDWDKFLKEMNDSGKPPSSVPVVVPTLFAIVSTIVTYMAHTFFGRKPIWQVASYSSAAGENARAMEIKLQYDSDHTRAVKQLIQSFYDGQVYGLGVVLVLWQMRESMRTVRKMEPQFDLMGNVVGEVDASFREKRVTYEGNSMEVIDPYMFFPDPRVPMTEVNKKGEFVFWRRMEAKHLLLREEAAGNYKWVKTLEAPLPRNQYFDYSSRSLVAGGHSIMDYDTKGVRAAMPPIQVDQGTIEIIPAELGLGDSDVPEKWLFTILNKSQIVQAEPFICDHNMHPVAVSEPYTQGHCFGNLGIADYGAQFQDVSSFLVNSHMDNIKSVLNNMFIVDPSMIEMQDVKRPGPGKLIRLKRAAYGQDVRNAIQQLQVTDITRANVADLETFSKISQIVTGVNENTMGIQDTGGRKTATEVRTAGEAAVSRMAFRSRLVSAQFMVDATEQMAMNNVQFLSQPFYLQVMGRDGLKRSLWISPEMLVGDYYFPIHDGTLPLDRVALLDVWREVFMAILGDQELRGMYDIGRVFEHIAELGGVKNLEAMRNTGGMGAGGTGVGGMGAGGMGAEIFGGMRVRGEEGIDAGVKSGNMVPMGRPFGGNTNDFAGLGRGAPPAGISPQPGRRLAGAY